MKGQFSGGACAGQLEFLVNSVIVISKRFNYSGRFPDIGQLWAYLRYAFDQLAEFCGIHAPRERVLHSLKLLLACMVLSNLLMSSDLRSNCKMKKSALLLPGHLAIYYGYPSLVNGADGDVAKAAATFSHYDVLVLGDGLEFDDVQPARHPSGPGTEEHTKARQLIALLKRAFAPIQVFGYLDLGNSQHLAPAELKHRIDLWEKTGVSGIFLDEAGFDYGVTRSRQNEILDYIHSLGLQAMANSFHPDDIAGDRMVPLNAAGGGNPKGEPSRMGAQDILLIESFQIRQGEYDPSDLLRQRLLQAQECRRRKKTRIFAVTTSKAAAFNRQQFDYAWWNAVLWQLDGFGWGEADFSSGNNRLTQMECPQESRELGGHFTSPVHTAEHGLSRSTETGTIVIDTLAHTAGFVPNRGHATTSGMTSREADSSPARRR